MRTCPIALVLAVVVLAGQDRAEACSVFTAHDGAGAFAGNNEDYYGYIPTIIWFVPPGEGTYGYVAYGYEDNHFSQGGINDQGLFWDGLATPCLEITGPVGDKPFVLTALEEVMQVAATVDEAITALREYDFSDALECATLLLADRFGNAAIFEGDLVTVPGDGKDYLIATNFIPSQPDLGNYPCWRYETLTGMMEDGFELTFDDFAGMAEAAHQGEVSYSGIYTRYTTVADLVNGVFYLYYDLDWDNPIAFDLEEELALGEHEYDMIELFYGDSDADGDTDGDADTDTGTDEGDDTDADDGEDPNCGCSTAGRMVRPPTVTALVVSLARTL